MLVKVATGIHYSLQRCLPGRTAETSIGQKQDLIDFFQELEQFVNTENSVDDTQE